MHHAARHGHKEVVRCLLEFRAEMEKRDKNGCRPQVAKRDLQLPFA